MDLDKASDLNHGLYVLINCTNPWKYSWPHSNETSMANPVFSTGGGSSGHVRGHRGMTLLLVDEIDVLITRDQAVSLCNLGMGYKKGVPPSWLLMWVQ